MRNRSRHKREDPGEVLSPSVLIFPGLFVFNSPVSKVVLPGRSPASDVISVSDAPPIVFIIFDEFPSASLMDEEFMIDAKRYPNFAALADNSYWFRNATTVHGSTIRAVPAILTGLLPDESRMPIALDYPHSLFTLLGGVYDMRVFESHTTICPETLCGDEQPQALERRVHSMLADVLVLYLHILVPLDLSNSLPAVTQQWKDFSVGTIGDELRAIVPWSI